jgi:hypothetical protein
MTKKHLEELAAIKRVLKLVDGYASNLQQHTLYAWDGGCMTWAELREQLQAATKFSVLKLK